MNYQYVEMKGKEESWIPLGAVICRVVPFAKIMNVIRAVYGRILTKAK